MELCETSKCVACGLCKTVCAQDAIHYIYDDTASIYPIIDPQKCIKCGLCVRACPIERKSKKHPIINVYAAWSLNEEERRTSASGGVAAELYKYYIQNSWTAFGVIYTPDKGSIFEKITTDNLSEVKNSKYVFTSDSIPYLQIAKALKDGPVLFIGLPCQVSAVKNYISIKHGNDLNLFTADLICHGVASSLYLNQHINTVTRGKTVERIIFRDPEKGTKNFYFSIYGSKNHSIYSKAVHEDDAYQLGYHKALIYRENCYNCDFACEKRVGDMTLGDFSGLGKIEPIPYENNNVSCVLVNTDKGIQMVKQLVENGRLFLDERPRDEALNFERQLISPSVPHYNRDVFLKTYKQTQDFDKSVYTAMRKEIVGYRINKWSGKLLIKRILLKIITPSMRKKIKEMIKR